MPNPDKESPLGLSPQWIDLGIVTRESIAWDTKQLRESDDPHPEHYRWRAFERFMKDQAHLNPNLANELYRLGDSDSDYSMGGSIMAQVLRHPECPDSLMRVTMSSDRSHLKKIAEIRLKSHKEEAEQDDPYNGGKEIDVL